MDNSVHPYRVLSRRGEGLKHEGDEGYSSPEKAMTYIKGQTLDRPNDDFFIVRMVLAITKADIV